MCALPIWKWGELSYTHSYNIPVSDVIQLMQQINVECTAQWVHNMSFWCSLKQERLGLSSKLVCFTKSEKLRTPEAKDLQYTIRIIGNYMINEIMNDCFQKSFFLWWALLSKNRGDNSDLKYIHLTREDDSWLGARLAVRVEQACPLLSGSTYRSEPEASSRRLRLAPVIRPSTRTGREQTCSTVRERTHWLSNKIDSIKFFLFQQQRVKWREVTTQPNPMIPYLGLGWNQGIYLFIPWLEPGLQWLISYLISPTNSNFFKNWGMQRGKTEFHEFHQANFTTFLLILYKNR